MSVSEYVRANREQLIHVWLERVQARPDSFRGQSVVLLRDHIPDVLNHVADCIDAGEVNEALSAASRRHAKVRHESGYSLRQLVAEYQVLRRVLIEQLVTQPELLEAFDSNARFALHGYIDAAIMDAIEFFVAERERTRQLFVGVLGHDLRSPLGTIRVSAEGLLQEGGLGERQTRRVARIGRAAGRMQRMIEELLDFTRVRMGRGFSVAAEPVDVRELVSASVDELAGAHPEREIRSLAAEASGDLRGHWDPDRLSQAMSNLLGNAVEHGTDPIIVRLDERAEYAAITVESGGEIPPELQDALFDPFQSAGPGTPGLGLGLYITREIARAHGGTVEVESTAERRTAFRLVIPRRGAGRGGHP